MIMNMFVGTMGLFVYVQLHRACKSKEFIGTRGSWPWGDRPHANGRQIKNNVRNKNNHYGWMG